MKERKVTSTNFLNESLMEAWCVLNWVLKILGKRWMPEILLLIDEEGVHRFSTLKEMLVGISDQMLSRCLAELVRLQLVEKKYFQEVPLRVEYSLTKSGMHLVTHLHELCQWGKRYVNKEKFSELT